MKTDHTLKTAALRYHAADRPGKTEIRPTKPHRTQRDLALAYSPGVAYPCLEIAAHPEAAYDYTNKGNLVAVVTNGTAVLGLGAIGAAAAKPVMEGKAMLFKTFAGIDAFDIELDTTDPDEFVRIVSRMAPSFGAVNLEDIKAPECFEIERRLCETLDIPVMHDDQHGTAVASARLFLRLGIRRTNLVMCDSRGVVTADRGDLPPTKREFATARPLRSLSEALEGADVFLGVSKADLLTPAMVRSMAARPLVMALANPDPEISYAEACASRPDILLATGRSDHPNQVNNVLGFPYIFRGALDVRATGIDDAMKLAAARALAELARRPVPRSVLEIYGLDRLEFGPEYLIPKPFDPRLLTTVAPAVARAAVESGIARRPEGLRTAGRVAVGIPAAE